MQPKDSQEPGTLDPRLSSPRLPPAPPVGRSKFCGFRDFVDLVDKWLSGSYLGRLFRLADSGHVSIIAFLLRCIIDKKNDYWHQGLTVQIGQST